MIVRTANHGKHVKRIDEYTRYFVAMSKNHIDACMEPGTDMRKFIIDNFKEIYPEDLTVGEWQSMLGSGLVVGVTDWDETTEKDDGVDQELVSFKTETSDSVPTPEEEAENGTKKIKI